MVTKEKCGDLVWIDMESPTHEEVRSLVEEYAIHPLVADELLSPSARPKVDVYKNLVYLILHFPTISHSHGDEIEQEIDFIIGKSFFVTVHYSSIDSLEKSNRLFSVNAVLKKCNVGAHAGYLFFFLMKELYENLMGELEYVQSELDKIENNIFNGKEHKMVPHISRMNRKLLHFKKATSQHKQVLESLEREGEGFFGKEFNYYLHAITGEYYKVSSLFEADKDILGELKATNDSLLTTKTNDIMKVLTIMAFIMLPLTLFSSLFSMNTEYLPLVEEENGFWLIVGAMIVLAGVFFLYFKHKKWF
ncbi:MAG: magnesium transporter CorA family protein [Parcubacteria group bacterium]|nr:magnesium transporter CorA family protein [Parcubacteria group bacterium]